MKCKFCNNKENCWIHNYIKKYGGNTISCETKQGVWYKGKHRIFQDLSLEEQEDFWKDIEANAKTHNYLYSWPQSI